MKAIYYDVLSLAWGALLVGANKESNCKYILQSNDMFATLYFYNTWGLKCNNVRRYSFLSFFIKSLQGA